MIAAGASTQPQPGLGVRAVRSRPARCRVDQVRMQQEFDKLPGVTIDYLSLADCDSLAEVHEATATTVALVAVRWGASG